MSDLLGNPKDRFPRDMAHINNDEYCVCLYTQAFYALLRDCVVSEEIICHILPL